jgi:hypothetical protein
MTEKGKSKQGRTSAELRSRAKEAVKRGFKLRPEDSTVDVTMIGSTGTGKTTLLASMYERFGHVAGGASLDVHTLKHGDAARLNGYVENLHRLPASIRVSGGIPGTGILYEYTFGVGVKGRRPAFNLRFTDYPGKYVLDPSVPGAERVSEILRRSQVILVAIDTPALVELNGRYHEAINRTMTVLEEVKGLLRDNTVPRLVILTLLKSEKYLKSREDAAALTRRAIEGYRPLLEYIKGGELAERTACVLAPVQTVGSVVLSRAAEDESGGPVFYFRSTSINAVYAPEDTDQPLRYTLRFVINSYRLGERPWLKSMWEQVIGVDKQLVAAVEEFASGCKADNGFAILQDHEYLHATPGPAGAR